MEAHVSRFSVMSDEEISTEATRLRHLRYTERARGRPTTRQDDDLDELRAEVAGRPQRFITGSGGRQPERAGRP